MLKHLRNQRGEALLVFLIGLMLTMVVAAKEASDLRSEIAQCEAKTTLEVSLK